MGEMTLRRHAMEALSASLDIYMENPLATDRFPSQRDSDAVRFGILLIVAGHDVKQTAELLVSRGDMMPL